MTNKTTEHRTPSDNPSVTAIRAKVLELEAVILENTPAGRRQSVALTTLETCSMWAVKAAVVGG